MLGSDRRESERGRKGGKDQAPAYSLALFGKAGHDRQYRKSGHRRGRHNEPDPGRVDSDGLQPDREKRQMSADQAKQRTVEQRQARRKSSGRNSRWDGDY